MHRSCSQHLQFLVDGLRRRRRRLGGTVCAAVRTVRTVRTVRAVWGVAWRRAGG